MAVPDDVAQLHDLGVEVRRSLAPGTPSGTAMSTSSCTPSTAGSSELTEVSLVRWLTRAPSHSSFVACGLGVQRTMQTPSVMMTRKVVVHESEHDDEAVDEVDVERSREDLICA